MAWQIIQQLILGGSAVFLILLATKMTSDIKNPVLQGFTKILLIFMSLLLVIGMFYVNFPILDTALQQNQTNSTYINAMKSTNLAAIYIVGGISIILLLFVIMFMIVGYAKQVKEVGERKKEYNLEEE